MNIVDNPLQSIGEIHRLKSLCVRAADALEQDEQFVSSTQLEHWIAATEPLIDELRKAAG